jgi:hypothetical protein
MCCQQSDVLVSEASVAQSAASFPPVPRQGSPLYSATHPTLHIYTRRDCSQQARQRGAQSSARASRAFVMRGRAFSAQMPRGDAHVARSGPLVAKSGAKGWRSVSGVVPTTVPANRPTTVMHATAARAAELESESVDNVEEDFYALLGVVRRRKALRKPLPRAVDV